MILLLSRGRDGILFQAEGGEAHFFGSEAVCTERVGRSVFLRRFVCVHSEFSLFRAALFQNSNVFTFSALAIGKNSAHSYGE